MQIIPHYLIGYQLFLNLSLPHIPVLGGEREATLFFNYTTQMVQRDIKSIGLIYNLALEFRPIAYNDLTF